MKRCLNCKKSKPTDQFWKQSRAKDGRNPRCIPCAKAYTSKIKKKNTAQRTAYNRKWRAANPDKVAAWRPAQNIKQNAFYFRQRLDLITTYGGSCTCCGETLIPFLTIEHINGLPPEHKTANGKRRGTRQIVNMLWNDLQKGVINKLITILCFNCNSGRAANKGVCPHKEVMPL